MKKISLENAVSLLEKASIFIRHPNKFLTCEFLELSKRKEDCFLEFSLNDEGIETYSFRISDNPFVYLSGKKMTLVECKGEPFTVFIIIAKENLEEGLDEYDENQLNFSF